MVVRSYDFAEADRIVVLLTRGHGLVRGVAKGVRRSKSRFGSRVQLFVELDVLLYPGRALANITAADTVSYFGAGIIEDYPRYTTACAALEAAERLAVAENGEDPFLYDALLTTLRRIQQHPDPTLVLDAFLLPWTTLAGHPACSTARSAANPARIALSTRRLGERSARNAVRRDPPPRPRRRCG